MSKQHPLRKTPSVLASACAAALISACGGGGTTATSGEAALQAAPAQAQPPVTSPTPTPAPTILNISGVAATGAPMVGARVTISDSLGASVCDQTTDTAGRYSCVLANTARAPFAIKAALADLEQFSVLASAQGGTANVTPLTTVIVSRLTPDGNPASLAAALHSNPSLVTERKLQDKIDEIQTLLAPVLSAVGDRTDPIRGSFVADGSGHDRVLDALQVTIRTETASSNIEITVKIRPETDSAPPVKLSFKSDETAPVALTAVVHTAALVDSGIVGLLNGLAGRFTACYAEPLRVRISDVAAGTVQATGDAGAVSAQACKSLFLDDDPSKFLDSGSRVGSSGGFSGLFKDSSTRASFDKFAFEYQLANGDIFVTFRSLTTAGVEGLSAITVRKQGGQLKVVGNQYRYNASVEPFASQREFPLQPKFSWFGSGYNVAIPNTLDSATRLPLFAEARVTAPDGRLSTYRPLAGRTNMGIVGDDGRQRVNTIQFFGSQFATPQAGSTPATKDSTGGAYFLPTQLGEDALRALPDQGVWQIEWVHADSSKGKVMQHYRTLRRAPTLGEVRQMKFATLTSDFRQELVARKNSTGSGLINFGEANAASPNRFSVATATGGAAWTVPEGALAPTSITVYGGSPISGSYNNGVTVGVQDRKTTINCVTNSATDFHCDANRGVNQFAGGSWVSVIGLFARTERRMGVEMLVNLYGLNED